MYKCFCGTNKHIIKKFLSLPTKLYSKKFLTQNLKLEKQILNNEHILSNEFEVTPFIVLDENRNIVSRCILTYYPNDTNAYVGFFDSFNNQEACNLLLSTVEKKAKKDGKKNLVGPIDCSFWINYRFKINYFENVYTGEPYNLEYYPKLWKNYGFKMSDHYISNHLRIPTQDDVDEKCKKRLETIISRDYKIEQPTKDTFDKNLEEIYELLIKLYSNFPGYKYINKEQFYSLFSYLKLILDFNMVKLAYKNNELVGFYIAIPNYSYNSLGNLNIKKIINILKIKKNPKEFVSLYLGANYKHLGLGGAFAELAKKHLEENKQSSISALIHDDKFSGVYYNMLSYKQYEYELYKKEI